MFEYTDIYNDFKKRNFISFKNDEISVDSLLNNYNDNRRCFGISSNINSNGLNENYYNMINDIQNLNNKQIVYLPIDNINSINQGISHFSLLNINQFNSFDINKKFIDDNIEKYIEIFTNEITHINKFNIYWNHLCLIPSGFCLLGIPDINIQQLRINIIHKIKTNKLLIDLPYFPDIVHTTIYRLSNFSSDKDEYINIYNKYKDTQFGFSEINHINLLFGNWKSRNQEIIKTIHI